jgi:sec-independent protein translocase protein TatA
LGPFIERRATMLGGLGPTELIVILFIVLILFGAGKLPEIGGALGKGIRNFKKATKEAEEIDITPTVKEIPDEGTTSKKSEKKMNG